MSEPTFVIYDRITSTRPRRTGELVITVERIVWNAQGGPELAVVRAEGDETDVWEFVEWLRSPVEIYDPEQEAIWWGMLAGAEVHTGRVKFGVELGRMANRLRMIYTRINAAGQAGERAYTPWVQDDGSIAEFGTREAQISISQATDERAEQEAAAWLARLSRPTARVDILPSPVKRTYVQLYCRGWYDSLGWKLFENLGGKESYEESGGSIGQPIKKGLTSGNISFEDDGGTYKIKSTTEELLAFSRGETVYVSGTTGGVNNGAYTIISVRTEDPAGSYLVVEQAVSNQSAGPSVTIQTALSVTQGVGIAAAVDWEAATIRVYMKKEGAPTDNVNLTLSSDVVLATASLAGTEISERMSWHDFKLSNRVQLETVTQYWIVIERSGGISAENYYAVGINEAAGYPRGAFYIHDGAGYVVRDPAADLLFVVAGVRETSKQIEDMALAAGQFLTAIRIETATGVYEAPYRNGDRTALAEIGDLLNGGTANGRRLLARVDRQRRLVIYEEPLPGMKDQLLDSDGEVRDYINQPLHASQTQAGVWMRLKEVIPGSVEATWLQNAERMFIEQVIYERGAVQLRARDEGRLLSVR